MLVIESADQHADLEYLDPFLVGGTSSKENFLNSYSTKKCEGKRQMHRLQLLKSYKLCPEEFNLLSSFHFSSDVCRMLAQSLLARGLTTRPKNCCSVQSLSRPKKTTSEVKLLYHRRVERYPPSFWPG